MNLKLIGLLIGVGLIAGAFTYTYRLGAESTKLEYENQAKEQQIRDYQKLQAVESRLTNQKLINDKQYKELSNELLQTTDSLKHCTLSTRSVRTVYKSAMQAPASNSTDDATIARIIADSESELTAQDITLTLINHDNAYFNCKAVVDSWQEWYRTMKEGRNDN